MATKHVSLRLSLDRHSRLVAAAERNHRSLSNQIEWYIDCGLAGDESEPLPVRHHPTPRSAPVTIDARDNGGR
jgi:hypothetical protein